MKPTLVAADTLPPMPDGMREVVEFVRRFPGARNAQIRAALGLAQTTMAMRLTRARDAGLVCMTGSTRAARWYTTEAVPAPQATGRWVRVAAYREGAAGRLYTCEGVGETFEEALNDQRIAERAGRWVLVQKRARAPGLRLVGGSP